MQMAGKCVTQARPEAIRATLDTRVLADSGDEEIEQSIAVVVEEHRGGGVTAAPRNAGLRRDVREPAAAVVGEEDVSLTDRSHEEIGIGIIVDVREGGADRG